MTRREIATLACRILVLYMLVRVLEMLAYGVPAMVSNVYSRLSNPSPFYKQPYDVIFAYIIPTLLPPVIYALFALLLWHFSSGVAKALIRDESSAQVTTNLSANEILFLTFSILGVMDVVYFAAWLASLFGNALTSSSSGPRLDWNGETFGTCVHLLLGLGLLFGARRLANMIEANGAVKETATIETS